MATTRRPKFKPCETKWAAKRQQSLAFIFECDLCGTGYVGFTWKHLHQCVEGHKHSTVWEQVKEPLQKCHSIFRNVHLLPLAWISLRILLLLKSAAPLWLLNFYKVFSINDLKQSLNDPICAKVLSNLSFNVFYDSFLLMDIHEFWWEPVSKLSLTCYQKLDPISQSGWNT